MYWRKDSDSLWVQTALRTHTEPRVAFAMSREGLTCTSNHQTRPEINAGPSHLYVPHEVPHCKCLQSPGHLLLTALPWRLALPWSRIMTRYFTPHPQLPCPKLQAQCCLHWRPPAPQRKPLCLLNPSDKSMDLLLPAKFTLTYWTGNKSTGSRRNGVR